MRALWILALCCAAAAVAMFAAFAFQPSLEGTSAAEIQALSVARRARADQRIVAKALEDYVGNLGRLPPASIAGSPPPGFVVTASMLAGMPYGDETGPRPLVHVQTAVACHFEREGYLLVSPGPDGDYDIDDPRGAYAHGDAAKLAQLGASPWTYDPTNGSKSSGDVWRVKD